MQKYCPICDQPIKGRFCKNCGEFVKPYQHDVNYHFNESHDPKNDQDCTYHGTDQTSGAYQQGNLGWFTAKPSNTTSTMSDRERMARAKASFESHGATNTPRNGNSEQKASKAVTVFVVVMVLMCVTSFIVSAVGVLWSEFQDDGFDSIFFDQFDDDDDDDDMAYPFDSYYDDGRLTDEVYEELCEEMGFDEEGYRELDPEDVIALGGSCNGWVHFDTTPRTVARHIRSALADVGITASNYDTDVQMSAYEYLNVYGEIISYYEDYMYVILEDEAYEYGYGGYMELISDCVTGELMAVYVTDADLEVFTEACEAVMTELIEDEDVCDEIRSELAEVIEDTIAEQDENYCYLEYDGLCLNFEYDEGVDFPYEAWIYLDDADDYE